MVYWLSSTGATALKKQLKFPVTPPVTAPQPLWPTRGTRNVPPERGARTLRMLTATGSICAGVRLKAEASRAAEVVPSELVGNACTMGLVVEPLGSTPFRARTPW